MTHSTLQSQKPSKSYPIGSKFNRWTLIAYAGGKSWLCRCDCGTERVVDAYTVRNGISQSCGCYKVEQTKKKLAKDITGQRFGRLVAIKPTRKRGADSSVIWICQCDCGKFAEVTSTNLGNSTRSCGCLYMGINSIDLTGQRFGRLTVVSLARIGNERAWLCKCDCGREKIIRTSGLRTAKTLSCGCLSVEMSVERSTGPNHWNWRNRTVPPSQVGRGKPEYAAWREAVLNRDRYICRGCGLVAEKPVAHHLESYVEHPDLRLEISNGVTVCLACHREFHNLYGRKSNTKKQFMAYIKRKLRGEI